MIWKREDFSALDRRYRAAFINSLSGFKSANLIGTRSIDARLNLSIVSSVFHLGADPAMIGLVFRPDVVERHSLNNIRETGFFTVNHVGAEFYQKAHQTSARYSKDESEFEACGLGLEYIGSFFAPFVRDSIIKFGVQMDEELGVARNGTSIITGFIQTVSFPANLLSIDGYLNIENADTVAVSGLDAYHRTEMLSRMAYAKVDQLPEPIERRS